MKILLDTCVWGGAVGAVADVGHDVVWSGDWDEDPGDAEILARALAEQRILVTLDKDFGELAIVQGAAHHGIVRLVDIAARRQAPVCLQVIEDYGDDLLRGAVVTAYVGRVRVRPAD